MEYGFYLYPGSDTEFSGVDKKVDAQIKCFKKYYDFDKIILQKEEKSLIKSILWRLPFGSWGAKYNEALNEMIKKAPKENVRLIYIRAQAIDRRYVDFLSLLKETFVDAKILIEIPTYPYAKELLQDKTMWPWYFKDAIYRGRLKGIIDRIVTFSEDDRLFGIPTIKIRNGIMVDDIQMGISDDLIENGTNKINMVAVAQFQKSHGYERVIRGIAEYYKKARKTEVFIHMIGEGEEKKYYEELTRQLGVQKYIFFYGRKNGEELNKIYDNSDIGLSCFGFYKRGIELSSALKVREYLAHGLPVVTGAREDAFDDSSTYCLRFPNDNSIVSIEKIVEFYCRLLSDKEKNTLRNKVRTYAKNKLDMDVVMRPVIDYLK